MRVSSKIRRAQARDNLKYGLRRGELTLPQLLYVEAIDHLGSEHPEGLFSLQIANHAGVSSTYAQLLLQPLEELGYITIRRYENGHAYTRIPSILVENWDGRRTWQGDIINE